MRSKFRGPKIKSAERRSKFDVWQAGTELLSELLLNESSTVPCSARVIGVDGVFGRDRLSNGAAELFIRSCWFQSGTLVNEHVKNME